MYDNRNKNISPNIRNKIPEYIYLIYIYIYILDISIFKRPPLFLYAMKVEGEFLLSLKIYNGILFLIFREIFLFLLSYITLFHLKPNFLFL